MTLTIRKNGSLFPSVVNDLFDKEIFFPEFFTPSNNLLRGWGLESSIPSVNIIENTKDYKIELAAPGLKKSDFKIEVDSGYLTISAEQTEEKNEEEDNYKRREFSYSTFSRSFQLPENTLPDKIDARYEDGVLKLSIPKKEVTVSNPKKEIKVV